MVGVPKTIDNDLAGTDVTFGFHTAVQIATDAIDRLHTTAESHNRVIVVEVMGRHAGWIATYAGIAGVPTRSWSPSGPSTSRRSATSCGAATPPGAPSRSSSSSEGATPRAGAELATSTLGDGATDAFGHARLGGIAVALEAEIERRTGYESRMTILGHVQRGGTPDRL